MEMLFVILATFLAVLVLVLPFVLYDVMKPKFWQPAIIYGAVCGVLALFLGIFMAINNKLGWLDAFLVLPSGSIAGFVWGVVCGVPVRVALRKEYADYEKNLQGTKEGKQHARLIGGISLFLGVGGLVALIVDGLNGFKHLDNGLAVLGMLMFLGFGVYYLVSGNPPATMKEFILTGKINQGADPPDYKRWFERFWTIIFKIVLFLVWLFFLLLLYEALRDDAILIANRMGDSATIRFAEKPKAYFLVFLYYLFIFVSLTWALKSVFGAVFGFLRRAVTGAFSLFGIKTETVKD